MNEISKKPVQTLGYQFIPSEYLPRGKDEYYLRNRQNNNGIKYRRLNAYEIEVLVRNRNTSDDWNMLLVSDSFNPELVQNCKFFGLVRIGKLEPWYLEFHNLKRPVGMYNSTIISCDFGDNVVVDNVNYISHYIVGNEVLLVNVNEIATTDHAKFGNGILKQGEQENIRIRLEVCNENGGRSILPFEGMLPGDAWLWTRFRDNLAFQEQLTRFTNEKFDRKRGYYGSIGDRTVIKNTKIIKDVNIGSDAYLKGANKIKNVTINSAPHANTQIGEGCELVNGIVDYGCRIFYGVKAVRFFLASNSQLKYGARLINSYLGDNSTISCCEVLNSLIFPAHEQHHNNSFLCAALVGGQSNLAAGATIGSNHNSRSPDGEIVAGRGFWPGLCVSLKHNSSFASFCILTKGDYPAELNIPLPFSLVNNDVANDRLVIMPAYWFLYNMYALARNSWKYGHRDKRPDKKQLLEFDYLAPDTVYEIIHALRSFEKLVGEAFMANGKNRNKKRTGDASSLGKKLLQNNDPLIDELVIHAAGYENSRRNAQIIKIREAYHAFRRLVEYYTASALLDYMTKEKLGSLESLAQRIPASKDLIEWINVGGQLIPRIEVNQLVKKISRQKLAGWEDIHGFYKQQEKQYPKRKLEQALAAYKILKGTDLQKKGVRGLKQIFRESLQTREWMVRNIHDSRAKDYQNEFRRMVYDSAEEMNEVIGSLEDNAFIHQEQASLEEFRMRIESIIR